MARERNCDRAVRAGRMKKAEQFSNAAMTVKELADEDEDVDDAIVTLWVHAGIAASDVICCARLGEYAQTDNHNEAATLLGTAEKGMEKHLRLLLSLKTKVGYTHTPTSSDDVKRAARAAEALIDAARRAIRNARN